MTVQLDATAADAYAVLTDFANLTEINPAVQRASVRSQEGPTEAVLETEVQVCVLWFCKQLQQVQDMQWQPLENGGGTLMADVRPDESNLRYGHAQWRIWTCESRSCLSFVAEIEPDFWVPPLIGPWVIKRKLEQEALQTSEGIERLAKQLR
ncbi:SRPBCC family protein [uncultured Abyssibacter sp.]|uniref:SRPBCC family protein n=1 Tax=uncultured Abyssibacter sp. TaxID=2320202 RepID=UPI0032B14AE7